MAGDLLMSISQDEKERAVFRSRKMYQTDMDSNLATVRDIGRQEGMAEGMAKGRAEGMAQVAQKMKAMGEAVEKIQLFTGLSAESIKQL